MVVALNSLVASRTLAQRVDVAFARATTTHSLLNEPTGPVLSLGLPLYKRLGASFSAGWLRGTSTGIGVVCGGLINPDRCPTEPFDQTGHLFVVGLGATVRLLSTSFIRLSGRPEVIFANARSHTEGRNTTNTLSAERQHVGVSIGGDLGIYPSRRLPLGLLIGGAHARVRPPTQILVADGYNPFQYRWFSVNTLTVGATMDWERVGLGR